MKIVKTEDGLYQLTDIEKQDLLDLISICFYTRFPVSSKIVTALDDSEDISEVAEDLFDTVKLEIPLESIISIEGCALQVDGTIVRAGDDE